MPSLVGCVPAGITDRNFCLKYGKKGKGLLSLGQGATGLISDAGWLTGLKSLLRAISLLSQTLLVPSSPMH